MAGVDELKNTLVDRTKDVQLLTEENANLKAELDQRNKDFDAMKKDRDNLLADSKRTTEWYMEANRTASEAAEANDELKTKIADLRNRVGEQLAQIQDLNAEVHFHKEFGEGLDKQQKELQARYDELDSVNKEQAEKIRKLDAQNAYLKRLSDAKKKMRIVLNNGSMYDVEVGDKVHPVYDMNNNLFFVKTEGGTVTSFLIGKEPGNIAGWYMV
jgi:chromosome segregation ATPase